MSRKISFCLSSNIDVDNWTNATIAEFSRYYVLIYYASLINEAKGLKFINASLTEEAYNYVNNLPTDNSHEYRAYYDSTQLQDVVDFLNNEVIPALQNMPQETDLIIDIYGGVENFINNWYNGASYLKYFNVIESEIEQNYTGYIPNILETAIQVKDFFQSVIVQNNTYEIIIE